MRRTDLGIMGWVLLVLVSPAWAAQRLPTHRATVLYVGPFNDFTDGVTPETGMTVTNITCELYVRSDAKAASTRTAITLAASGSANDMVHITDDVAGMYSLELTAAQAWEDLIVEPNNVYDSGVAGTDVREVDAVLIDGAAPSLATVSDIISGLLDAVLSAYRTPGTVGGAIDAASRKR